MKAFMVLFLFAIGLIWALIGRQMSREGYHGEAAYGLAVIFAVIGIALAFLGGT